MPLPAKIINKLPLPVWMQGRIHAELNSPNDAGSHFGTDMAEKTASYFGICDGNETRMHHHVCRVRPGGESW